MSTQGVVWATDTNGGRRVAVEPGPRLLAGLRHGPSLEAHRQRHGDLGVLSTTDLLALLASVDIRGRGGAGFPFARKLETAARQRQRAVVVVNASEGEPASFKDAALTLSRPHLVLDGAALAARALGSRTVHLVVPSERPPVEESLRRAIAERSRDARPGGRTRWVVHRAEPRFVAGQARAVLELLSGRENLPVTAWQPEAVKGHRGRPTLLSNAETFAQVAVLALGGVDAFRALGTDEEPGTLLLTVHRAGGLLPRVVEVAHGTPWSQVLGADALAGPILVGGYHGTWVPAGALADAVVSRTAMSGQGLALGAGVALPLVAGDCPVHRTARLSGYLAEQSARRCGPCLNGLPALADAVARLDAGTPSTERIADLARLVTRRGACAHPDGTVRMVQSLLTAYPEEVRAHGEGRCLFATATAGAPDATFRSAS